MYLYLNLNLVEGAHEKTDFYFSPLKTNYYIFCCKNCIFSFFFCHEPSLECQPFQNLS